MDALVEAVRAAKGGDALREIMVLAPSARAAQAAGRRLAMAHGLPNTRGGATTGFVNVRVTTPLAFARELAAPNLAGREPETGATLGALWQPLLSGDPHFGAVAGHEQTVAAAVHAYQEWRQLSPASQSALQVVAASIVPPAPTAEAITKLFPKADAALANSSWFDNAEVFRHATSMLAAGGTPMPSVIMYQVPGCQAGEPERGMLTELVRLGATEAAPSVGGESEEQGTIQFPPGTELFSTTDPDEECRFAVRRVMAQLRDGIPGGRIGIFYAAAEYLPALHSQLTQAGITFNGPGVVPMAAQPIPAAFLSLGAMRAGRATIKEVLSRVWAARMGDAAGAFPVSRWRRIARRAGLSPKSDWLAALDSYMRRPGFTSLGAAASGSRDTAAEQRFRDFLADLLAWQRAGDACETWAAAGQWALKFVEQWLPATRDQAESQARAALRHVIETLGQTDSLRGAQNALAGTTGPVGMRAAFVAEAAGALAAIQPSVGTPGRGVLVAPISAAAGLSLDYAEVVGLSDDQFPGRRGPDSLLPERVRVAARAAGSQISDSASRVTERRAELECLAGAAKSLTLTFPRGNLSTGGERPPCRWLAELPSNALPSHAHAILRADDAPANESEWRQRLAAHQYSGGGLVLDAELSRAQGARKAMQRKGEDGLSEYDGYISEGISGLGRLGTEGDAISPSRLEVYAECPFHFFMQYVLKVKPVEEPADASQVSTADIGTIIHGAYEELVRHQSELGSLPGYGEPWEGVDAEQMERYVALAAERIPAERRGHPVFWQRELGRITAKMMEFLVSDNQWRAANGLAVRSSEFKFGDERPVSLELPGTSAAYFRGSADKVDQASDGQLFVTDLKSGASKGFFGFDAADPTFADGTKLQLPIYGLAAQQLMADDAFPAPSPAALYWFMHKESKKIPETGLAIDDGTIGRFKQTIGPMVANMRAGIFPGRPPAADDFNYTQCEYCNPDGIGYDRSRWEAAKRAPELAEYLAVVEPADSGAGAGTGAKQ